MAKLFIRLFKSGEWLEPPTIIAANYCRRKLVSDLRNAEIP